LEQGEYDYNDSGSEQDTKSVDQNPVYSNTAFEPDELDPTYTNVELDPTYTNVELEEEKERKMEPIPTIAIHVEMVDSEENDRIEADQHAAPARRSSKSSASSSSTSSGSDYEHAIDHRVDSKA